MFPVRLRPTVKHSSYTDPSGFFFKSIFKAIGKVFKAVFRAVRAVFKAILRVPLLKLAIQAFICAQPGVGTAGCAAISAGFSAGSTLAAGGSIGDALKSAAFTFARAFVFDAVGAEFNFAPFPVKEAIHGVVGGAFSVAQGGKFFQGFASNALGVAGGRLGETFFGSANPYSPKFNGSPSSVAGRTIVAAIAGGTGSVLTGGKFVNGAAAAAIAHLFNREGEVRRGRGNRRRGGFLENSKDVLTIGLIGQGATNGIAGQFGYHFAVYHDGIGIIEDRGIGYGTGFGGEFEFNLASEASLLGFAQQTAFEIPISRYLNLRRPIDLEIDYSIPVDSFGRSVEPPFWSVGLGMGTDTYTVMGTNMRPVWSWRGSRHTEGSGSRRQ